MDGFLQGIAHQFIPESNVHPWKHTDKYIIPKKLYLWIYIYKISVKIQKYMMNLKDSVESVEEYIQRFWWKKGNREMFHYNFKIKR